ncbi:CHC2 zinc finger domain-containing protein [uncultured Parabacteroides sp.]|uniref:CHC2 zinc finger domain-containing protein n=1 Tax=uncultured Parabacteroides sp. TaxID=512312 RepID=UPI00261CB165|nr:CHC2 zinc finger domain-containing protein [uncultured Parabacteroides sp.]
MIQTLRQRIVEAVHLENVANLYTELAKGSKSGKTLRCNCLFHRDEGKSFKIRLTEQIYECSICKETGDAVDLVQIMEGCNEAEALHILAERFNIPIEKSDNLDTRQEECQADVSVLHSIHENKEFNMIFESLDFCKSDSALFIAGHKYLELGVSPAVLPDQYEQIAGAMLFPVRDGKGVLRGFLKYMVEEKEQGCVCYPPNLADDSLLGLYQAVNAIEKLGFVYLVWNGKDLLTMHIAGFTNTVACCNGHLTDQQIHLLLQYTKRVVIIHTGEVPKQVRATKTAARLSFASAVPYRLSLFKRDLSALYRKLGAAKFEYFIRQVTRLIFLNALLDKWVMEQQVLTGQLKGAKSKVEMAEIRSCLIAIRNKQDKLSNILDENWEHLSWFLDKFVGN